MPCGKQLAQVGVDERQLGADADASQKAGHDEHGDVRAEGARQRKQ